MQAAHTMARQWTPAQAPLVLRPYQQAAVDALYAYFDAHSGNPLVCMPTGTGKSIVIAGFIRSAIQAYPNCRVLMLTHVRELISQNFAALLKAWPDAPAGIYSAGLGRRDINAQILFAGIQSIHKRAYQVQAAHLVIVDEAHLISRNESSMYRDFLAQLDDINGGLLKVIGTTATPYRLDSGLLHEGEDRIFTDIAYNVPMLDMIGQGYLCPVIPKRTHTQLDTSGVGTRGGEFIPGQLERAVDKSHINRSAVDEIVRHGQDRKSWLVFCSGVDHAHHIRDEIRQRGITCETVTGETPKDERDNILAAFKAGRLRAVTNMNVLTTGFDSPATDLIALIRPTKSVSLYVQMVGRGTRIAPDKLDCLVLDFAGNTARHGPIDTVDGRVGPKGEGDAPTRVCPECEAINHASARQCIDCGYVFPLPESKLRTVAAINPVLSTQALPQWLDVQIVRYAAHNKLDKPTSLKVTYQCGLVWHTEWSCFGHVGYPRTKAEAWWRQRAPGTPIPATTAEALDRTSELRTPTQIQVRNVGKFSDIIGSKFA